jgi:hypothetical protein
VPTDNRQPELSEFCEGCVDVWAKSRNCATHYVSVCICSCQWEDQKRVSHDSVVCDEDSQAAGVAPVGRCSRKEKATKHARRARMEADLIRSRQLRMQLEHVISVFTYRSPPSSASHPPVFAHIMGAPSQTASNAVIYCTYAFFLVFGLYVGWRYSRTKGDFLSSLRTQGGSSHRLSSYFPGH